MRNSLQAIIGSSGMGGTAQAKMSPVGSISAD